MKYSVLQDSAGTSDLHLFNSVTAVTAHAQCKNHTTTHAKIRLEPEICVWVRLRNWEFSYEALVKFLFVPMWV